MRKVGTAFLDFQVGKYQILPDFRNNAVELAKINNTIRTVTEDKNVKPTGIVLKDMPHRKALTLVIRNWRIIVSKRYVTISARRMTSRLISSR